LKLEERR